MLEPPTVLPISRRLQVLHNDVFPTSEREREREVLHWMGTSIYTFVFYKFLIAKFTINIIVIF